MVKPSRLSSPSEPSLYSSWADHPHHPHHHHHQHVSDHIQTDEQQVAMKSGATSGPASIPMLNLWNSTNSSATTSANSSTSHNNSTNSVNQQQQQQQQHQQTSSGIVGHNNDDDSSANPAAVENDLSLALSPSAIGSIKGIDIFINDRLLQLQQLLRLL